MWSWSIWTRSACTSGAGEGQQCHQAACAPLRQPEGIASSQTTQESSLPVITQEIPNKPTHPPNSDFHKNWLKLRGHSTLG